MTCAHFRKAVVLAFVSVSIIVGAAGMVEPTAQQPPKVDSSGRKSGNSPAALEDSARFVQTASFAVQEASRINWEEASVSLEAVPRAAGSLPPTRLETAADGLPASGLHCARDGSGFRCGACQTDSDCPAGKGCVANRETRRFECLDSECEEDAHCFPGLVCRRVSRWSSAPIRRCVPVGLRREGETCDTQFVSVAGACQEGLLCHRGRCSFPCRLGEPESCPRGHLCEESDDGAACFPDCRALGCPGGQRCKSLGGQEYQCLDEVQGQCPETPCAEGERCNMRVARGRGVFWCARLCDPLRADSCAAQEICGIGGGAESTCYRRCDPMEPDSCEEGSTCTTSSEDMSRWGCIPHGSGPL